MTNLITLTIPNDDHIALRAFGKALEEMALAHGAEPRKLNVEHTCQQLESKDDYRKWYEEAIEASNEAGYMCMSAADVIKNMAGYISTLENYGSAMYKKAESYSIDTTAQQVESLVGKPVVKDGAVIGTVSEVDAKVDNYGVISATLTLEPEAAGLVSGVDKTGTPWDERIHSASKALNADGTWRLRRKPKDMDEAEWAALIESIKGELQYREQLKEETERSFDVEQQSINLDHVSIDPAHGKGDETAEFTVEPPVTPPGDDFHTDTDVVTEQTVAGIPPLPVPQLGGSGDHSFQSTPYKLVGAGDDLSSCAVAGIPPLPVPPPVVVAPPVPEVTEWDFPRLMTFLTERHGKIDVATVNTLLAQDGLASVQELNAHPDKIGPFVARVKAHLGE
ncbi:TPA: hypothetical protein SIF59_003994 [Escherichia coli]|nr:hypothetical protein [Escherichia coli]HEI0663007.1 hypothetical protein [Escherichia coli]